MIGRSLRGFFRGAWRALDGLRRAVHLVLMLLVLLVVLIVAAARPDRLPEAFVLIVSPEGALVEQYSGDAISRALGAAQGVPRMETLVGDLVEAIDEAAGDRRVTAIHLDLGASGGGSIDKLATVAAALERFRNSGKPVIASATGFGLPQYYLAAHADEIYMDPAGGILLQGMGFYRTFYKAALDKLSLDWHVFRAGEAKSFGDPYTRNDMSAEERDNLRPIAEGLWAAWRSEVARARGLEPELLDDYIDNFLPRLRAVDGDLGEVALDAGLVDELRSAGEIEQALAGTGGRDPDGAYVGIYAEHYLASLRTMPGAESAGLSDRPAVGLVVASGDILPGEQPPGSIGDETLRELLREAREDDQIRALVLRVDSGGGSQIAAESIMRDIALVRAAGKPVVVSMGGVAASGGYAMSLPADEVWAHPTTITGSIGVVLMVPNFGRLLERVGVTVDGVGTHRASGTFRLDREFDAETLEILEVVVEGAYDRFLGQVAEGRDMPLEDVRRLAEGRIWLGGVALEAGLVDRLGNLDDALAAAAQLAGLEDEFDVVTLEPGLSFGEQLMVNLLNGAAGLGLTSPRSLLDRLPGQLRTLFTELERLDGFADPRGLYYYCFCESW